MMLPQPVEEGEQSVSRFHVGSPSTHAKGTLVKHGWSLQEQGEHSIQGLPCI